MENRRTCEQQNKIESMTNLLNDLVLSQQCSKKQDMELVDCFTSSLTNELQSQLTSIKELFQLFYEGTDQSTCFSLINREIQRMDEVLYKITSKKSTIPADFEIIDINLLLGECMKDMYELVFQKEIIIETNLERTGNNIFCNKAAIKRAFETVIRNEIEATPAYSNIEIVSVNTGTHILVTITNKILDISREDQGHCYGPFSRLKVNGTDVGLSICYKIIEGHYGSIQTETNLQKGTKVEIKLPLLYLTSRK